MISGDQNQGPGLAKRPWPCKEFLMGIAISPSVSAATTATQTHGSDAISIAVLKKAIDGEASAALGLIQALPKPAPALATQGPVGTKINTFA
jgi:hypothetical protein